MREIGQLCWNCGYHFNACTPAVGKEDAAPSDGDISLCFNCGETYERQAETWVPLPLDRLTAEERALVTRMQANRAVKTNLAKRPARQN